MKAKQFLSILVAFTICLKLISALQDTPYTQSQKGNNQVTSNTKTKFDNIHPMRDRTWKNPNLPLWSKVKYPGDPNLPSLEFKALRSYPMVYLDINKKNQVVTKGTKRVIKSLQPYDPKNIDFYAELKLLKSELRKKRTDAEIQNMYNWDRWIDGIMTPVVQTLYDSYKISVSKIFRINAFYKILVYDSAVLIAFYKFLYETPRSIQLDPKLEPYLCTHVSPSYPGGQAFMAGAILEWLSLLFPQERPQFEKLFADCARARFTSGVHFNADNIHGGRLGKSLGRYYYNIMKGQKDENGELIDKFENPPVKPVIKVPEYVNNDVATCKWNVNKISKDYLRRLKAKKNE